MLTNYHTHSTFCDGKDTLEQMAITAIEKGFVALGFSGHGYTKRDSSFCMRDTKGYLAEIHRLKCVYADKIQIYAGVEEDLICPVERDDFDYIIGSSHYINNNGKDYSIDGSPDSFQECVSLFSGDPVAMAEAYYKTFCDYILTRKPDIIGHFDLVTKFDEKFGFILMNNSNYRKLALDYLDAALDSECIFEVNTGAIARGVRTTPYPSEELLYRMKERNAKLIISSDCHDRNKLDFYFKETVSLLKNIGFTERYVLLNNGFQTVKL